MPVTVNNILKTNFSQLTLEKKIDIKTRGRPTPEITISQPGVSNNKKYIRSFNREWYKKWDWLCGCDVRNALFCFPCLLLGGEPMWSKDGFTNVNKMKEKTDKHAKSKIHMENVISLSLLGRVSVCDQLRESNRISINKHNERVKENRLILSKLVTCLKFCGNFETPLRRNNEKEESESPGVFKGLIHFGAELDSDLRSHLSNNPVFKRTPQMVRIQSELLDCMLQVCRERVSAELDETSYVAVVAHDVTDISEDVRTAAVVRYELNGKVFERFWGFSSPEPRAKDGLSKSVLDQFNAILKRNSSKLIAHSFNAPRGDKAEIETRIKQNYENTHYVNCNDQEVDSIMKNAASGVKNARIFFSNLSGISSFFCNSSLRSSILSKHVPTQSPSGLNFDVGTVQFVYENKEFLKAGFEELQSALTTDKIVRESSYLLQLLKNKNFLFWLEFFHKITFPVDTILNQMLSRNIYASKIQEHLNSFNSAIVGIRNSDYWETFSQSQIAESREVCDSICAEIRERYCFTNHLLATKLFYKENFPHYSKSLPSEEIAELIKAYPVLEQEKLQTELQVFYSRKELHNFEGLVQLLRILTENSITDVLSEITKLIKILITIPMTTAEPERCFFSLSRITTFLKYNSNQDRLTALAMISMEKSMIRKIDNFEDKVINLFSTNKERRVDFIFK